MPAADLDLLIEQGTTWSKSFQVTIDGDALVGEWTGAAQVRKSIEADLVLHQFAVDVDASTITLSVEPAQSSPWTWTSGVYDVELTSPDGAVIRVLQGRIRVSREVTR